MKLREFLQRVRTSLKRRPAAGNHKDATHRLRAYRPVLELLEDRLAPATATWINAAGGDWDTASNWSGATGAGGLPGPHDDVVINLTSVAVVHSGSSASDSIKSLTLANTGDSLNLSGGTLELNGGTVSGPGSFTISGGTLSDAVIAAGSTLTGEAYNNVLENATVDGVLDLATHFTSLTVTGGLGLNGRVSIDQGSQLLFSGSGAQTLSTATAGTVSFGKDDSSTGMGPAGSGTTLVIGQNILVDGTIGNIGNTFGATGSGSLINDGTIAADASAGGGTIVIAATTWSNAGKIEATRGNTIELGGTSTASAPAWTNAVGATITTTGGTIDLGGSGTLPTSGSAQGSNWLNQGTISESGGTGTIALAYFNNVSDTITPPALGTLTRLGGPADGTLNLQGTLVNTGTTLLLDGNAGTTGSSGSTYTVPGSLVLVAGTIQGGTVQTQNGAKLISGHAGNGINNMLAGGVTLDGTLDMATFDAYVTVTDGLTLNGTVNLANASQLLFSGTDSQTLSTTPGDSGTVSFGTYAPTGMGPAASGTTLVIGPNITVDGNSGEIGYIFGSSSAGSVTNDGTINADSAGGDITINAASFTNNGIMESSNGDTLTVTPTTLTNFSSGTLTGGTWEAQGGGTLRLIGASMASNAATILLDGASSHIYSDTNTTDALAGFTSNTATGSFTIQDGANLSTAQAFSNAGSVTIASGSAFTLGGNQYVQTGGTTVLAGGTLGALVDDVVIGGGTLSGPGTIGTNLTNEAEVDLGGTPGTLNIAGSYNQSSVATLTVQVGGTAAGQFDQVNVAGSAALGGTLTAELVNGFGPSPGQTFPVVTFGSSGGGAFSTFNSPQVNGQPVFSTQSTQTSVDLLVNTLLVTTTTVLTADPNPVILGLTAGGPEGGPNGTTLTAVVTDDTGTGIPVGSIDFVNSTTNTDYGTVPLIDGAATLGVDSFDPGSYTIVATFVPSDGSDSSSGGVVVPVVVGTSVAVSPNPVPGIVGQPVVFTAQVTNTYGSGGTPTGRVQFQVDGSNVGQPIAVDQNGNAAFSDSSLTAGTHTIAALYTPTGVFASSQGGVQETVDVGDDWTGAAGDGKWDTAGNWTKGVPQDAYDVFIANLPANAVITLGPADVANHVTISSPLTFSGGQLTVAAVLADSAALTLSGGATLSVPAPFSMQSVSIEPGSTLSGQGTVLGDVVNAGALDMGAMPGAVTIKGNYTQDAMAMLTVKIGGAIVSDNQQLNVLGSTRLDGTLKAQFMGGFTPAGLANIQFLNLANAANGAFSTFDTPMRNGQSLLSILNTPAGLGFLANALPTVSVSYTGVPTWQPEGPAPINGAQLSTGTYTPAYPDTAVGAIESVVSVPHTTKTAQGTVTTYTLYAGAANGGVWRADNVYADSLPVISWTPLTDTQKSLGVSSMALDPIDRSGNTLWVGTGTSSSFYGTGGPAVGLLMTTDGGSSWSDLAAGDFINDPILSVMPTGALNSSNHKEIILAGTASNGVWRSTDGGAHFAPVPAISSGAVNSIVADPVNHDRFYAAVNGVGVFQTFDDGASWFEIDNALAQITSSPFLVLAASKTLSGGTNLFLGTSQAATGKLAPYKGVLTGVLLAQMPSNAFQSVSWAGLGTSPALGTSGFPSGQLVGPAGHFSLVTDPDPNNANVVYVSGWVQNLYRVDATNGAATAPWTAISGGTLGVPHDDQRSLVFLNPTTLMVTDDGGLYALTNPNKPTINDQWVSLNNSIQDTEFFQVAYDSINGLIFGGNQDNGTPVQAIGQTWTQVPGTGGDGGPVAVDNSGTEPVYYTFTDEALNRTQITKFASGSLPAAEGNVSPLKLASRATPSVQFSGLINGNDQKTASAGGDTSYPIAIDTFAPSPEPVLIGLSGIYEAAGAANDFGVGDVIVNFTPKNMTGSVTTMTYASEYAAYVGTNTQQLFYRPDLVAGQIPPGFGAVAWPTTAGNVAEIVSDPADPKMAYVLDNYGNIFGCADVTASSVSWTLLSTGLPRGFVGQTITLYDPTANTPGDGVLLVGGLGGVYRANLAPADLTVAVGSYATPKAPPVWTLYGQGLPNVLVTDMHYVPANSSNPAHGDILLVGTFGRGAWEIANASATLTVPGQATIGVSNGTILLRNDPVNPANAQVLLEPGDQLQMEQPWALLSQINLNGDVVPLSQIPSTNTATLSSTIDIQDVNAGTTVNIDVEFGVNMVNVGSANELNSVLGPVNLNGDLGTDTLNINDQNDSAESAWTIGESGATLDHFDSTGKSIPVSAITYDTTGGITLNAGSGFNSFAVNGTPSFFTFTLNTGDGQQGNVVTVDNTGGDCTLNVNNGGPTTLAVDATANGSALNISDFASPNSIVLGNNGTVQNIQGTVKLLQALVDADTLSINDGLDTGMHTVTVTNTSVDGLAPANINYNPFTLKNLFINGSSGGSTWNVQSTEGPYTAVVVTPNSTPNYPTTTTTINCDGKDTINVGDNNGVQDIKGTLNINSTQLQAQIIQLDDHVTTYSSPAKVSITNASITGLAPATINYGTLTPDGVYKLTVEAGTGGTIFTLGSMFGGPANVYLSALGSGNSIVGPNTGPTWKFQKVNGLPQDSFTEGIAASTVFFSGMQAITGGSGNDDFQFIGSGFGGTIDGGPGSDTFDYSQSGNPVVTVSPAGNGSIDGVKGTATGITSFDNIDDFIGDNGSGSDFSGPSYSGDFSNSVSVSGFATMALAVPGHFSGQLLAGTEGTANNPISSISVGGTVTGTIKVGFLQTLTVTGDMDGLIKCFGDNTSTQTVPSIQTITIGGSVGTGAQILAEVLSSVTVTKDLEGTLAEGSVTADYKEVDIGGSLASTGLIVGARAQTLDVSGDFDGRAVFSGPVNSFVIGGSLNGTMSASSILDEEFNGPAAGHLYTGLNTAPPVYTASGDVAGLIQAINQANMITNESNIIDLLPGSTYVLTTPDNSWYGPNGLPAIASNITINGNINSDGSISDNGAVIERSAGVTPFRIFYVSGGFDTLPAGQLTLNNLTVEGGLAQGGNGGSGELGGGGGAGLGGAIFNQGTLNLNGVTLTQNFAQGGRGGTSNVGEVESGNLNGGGGGGGLGGDGGDGNSPGGDTAPGTGGGGGGGGGGFATAGSPGSASSGGSGGNGTNSQQEGGSGAATGMGGNGNFGGGGGGGGLSGYPNSGGNGGVGGGGGGSGGTDVNGGAGGAGGFGGGGGGANTGFGGDGGFGGGGGASSEGDGNGGFGGGGRSSGGLKGGSGGAGMGGAIFNMSGVLNATNSTLAMNSALGGQGGQTDPASYSSFGGIGGNGFGGAIFNLNGTATLINDTIAGNSVVAGNFEIAHGNDLYNLALDVGIGNPPTATVSLTNDVLAGTGSNDDVFNDVKNDDKHSANATITALSTNLIQHVARGTVTGSGIVINGDPVLGPLQHNGGPTPTMEVLARSPLLQQVNFGLKPTQPSNGVPATDQRGVDRGDPAGSTILLGAYQATTATHFGFANFPSVVNAGVLGFFTISAQDSFNKTVYDYAGMVSFQVTGDAAGTVPQPSTLTDGTGTFADSMNTAGVQSLIAGDGKILSNIFVAVEPAAGSQTGANDQLVLDPNSTPQHARVGTEFAYPLRARVTDALGNGVSGQSVTFTINSDSNGASGAFAASAATTVTTDQSGYASLGGDTNQPNFTANGIADPAGYYTVTATYLSQSVNFDLTNEPGPPAHLTKIAGDNQTTPIGLGYQTQLEVKVTDTYGNAVGNIPVIFTAPAAGPSGVLSGSTTATVMTDAAGMAMTPLTANDSGGTFYVSASLAGPVTPTLTSITPTWAAAGNPDVTITATGTNFVSGATVDFNGTPLATTFVSSTQLTALIPAADLTAAGTDPITVVTPAPDGGTSVPQIFTVNSAGPASVQFNSAGETVNETAGTFSIPVILSGTVTGTGTPTVSTFASGFGSPAGLAFYAGNLYVANFRAATVSKVTPAGVVSHFASGFDPLDLAFDADGNLYASIVNGSTVSKVTPTGVTTFASGFNGSDGLAFDSFGNLYVASNNDNTVRKVTPAGVVTTFASGLNFPSGLAFDAAGNLYVSNAGDYADGYTIAKVTPAGVVTTFASGLNGPRGLAFDAAGNLYVASINTNTVSKVTTAGVVSTFASGFTSPFFLAFDAAGNLYVSNANGTTVSEVTTSTSVSVPFTLGGTATAGTDYSGVTTSPLVIPAGQTTATITGTLVGGSASAGKTLTFTLGMPDGAGLGSPAINTLTIGGPASTVAPVSFTETNTAAPLPASQLVYPVPADTSSGSGTPPPKSLTVGQAFGFQVYVEDANGEIVQSDSSTVTATISGPEFPSGESIPEQVNNGMAAFTPLSFSQTGTYTLKVSDPENHGLTAPPPVTINVGLPLDEIPATLKVISGSGQSSPLNTPYPNALVVEVDDANGQPITNGMYLIHFAGPSAGPSVRFAQPTVTAGANGQASDTPTPISAPGPIMVTASLANPPAGVIVNPVTFSLTSIDVPASISGKGSYLATVNTDFGTHPQVTVKDASGKAIAGVTVTWTAAPGVRGPNGVPSASFPGFPGLATSTTNSSGVASAPTILAGKVAGIWTLDAGLAGQNITDNPVTFRMTNTAGTADGVAAHSGSGQKVQLGKTYAPLEAYVADQFGNPVSGVTVLFTVNPGKLASGLFPGKQRTFTGPTDAAGLAKSPALTAIDPVTAPAGQIVPFFTYVGGKFTVTPSVKGAITRSSFELTIAGADPVVSPPQSATVGRSYAKALYARVTDLHHHPLAGVPVTFLAPVSGPSGTFAGKRTVTVRTNADGIATAPAFTANTQAGTFSVSVVTQVVPTPDSIGMTNLAGRAAKLTLASGNGQSAAANAVFAIPLAIRATDTYGNVISGAQVNFTVRPNTTSGAAGAFGTKEEVTLTTDDAGLAIAGPLAANGKRGRFRVTVSVAGDSTEATFDLTVTN